MSTESPSPAGAVRAGAVQAAQQVVDAETLPAVDRLAASRSLMRAAMLDFAHPPPRPRHDDSSAIHDLGTKVLAGFKGLPGVTILVESLEGWWAQHPLRAVAIVAGEASKKFVRPVAQRNPLGLMIGAVVVGALLVASHPWRWLLRPALFIGLVPQLASHIVKRLPLDSWMSMLSSVLGSKRPAVTPTRARRTPGEAASGARASNLPVPPL